MDNRDTVINTLTSIYGDMIGGNIVIDNTSELEVRQTLEAAMESNINIDLYLTITQYNNSVIISQ